MRLIVGGGRAAENSDSGGAVVVGVRTLSEGGRVGNFSREQVGFLYFYFYFFNCGCPNTIFEENVLFRQKFRKQKKEKSFYRFLLTENFFPMLTY